MMIRDELFCCVCYFVPILLGSFWDSFWVPGSRASDTIESWGSGFGARSYGMGWGGQPPHTGPLNTPGIRNSLRISLRKWRPGPKSDPENGPLWRSPGVQKSNEFKGVWSFLASQRDPFLTPFRDTRILIPDICILIPDICIFIPE